MSLPYFKFHPADYLGNHALMALPHATVGVWFMLLCHLWQSRAQLPDSDEYLARLFGLTVDDWQGARTQLLDAGMIVEREGKLVAPDLAMKHEDATAYSLAQALKRQARGKGEKKKSPRGG